MRSNDTTASLRNDPDSFCQRKDEIFFIKNVDNSNYRVTEVRFEIRYQNCVESIILNDIQERETIKYYIDDEILTIEITQQQPALSAGAFREANPRLEMEREDRIKSPASEEGLELQNIEKCTNSAGGKTQTEKVKQKVFIFSFIV